jgi:hypothetical protein
MATELKKKAYFTNFRVVQAAGVDATCPEYMSCWHSPILELRRR